ncbi:hypothetical protein ABK040_008342 [Willaertia magna]
MQPQQGLGNNNFHQLMLGNNNQQQAFMKNQAISLLKHQQQYEMELLSLQQEIRQKNVKIKELQAKYIQLEDNFKYILNNHKELINKLSEQERELREERERSNDLQNSIQLQQIEMAKIQDSEEKNKKQQLEIESLKKVNKSLQETLLDTEKFKEKKQNKKYETIIEQLKSEIRQWSEKLIEQQAKYSKLSAKFKLQESQLEQFAKKMERKNVSVQTLEIPKVNAQIQTKVSTFEDYNKTDEAVQVDLIKNLVSKTNSGVAYGSNVVIERRTEKKTKIDLNNLKSIVEEIPARIDTLMLNMPKLIEQQPTTKVVTIIEQPQPPVVPVVINNSKNNTFKIQFTKEKNECNIKLYNIKTTTDLPKEYLNLPYFLSVDFFNNETQLSSLNYGFNNTEEGNSEVLFDKPFEFDNSNVLVYYLINGFIIVKLLVSHSNENYEVIGQGEVLLRDLMKEQKKMKGVLELIKENNSDSSETVVDNSSEIRKVVIAEIKFEVELKESLANCILNYNESEVVDALSNVEIDSL